MENSFDKTATETIDLLEARLRRIEYAVCGHIDQATLETQKDSATKRMSDLEQSLHQLASKSKVIQDLLKLHSKHPDLFQQISPNEVPTTLDTSSLLSIILASASSYPSTASRLTSVVDTPIPPTRLSAQLIDLQPRIAKIGTLQASQSAELAELRERSATAIQQWYAINILQSGDLWAEIEGRVGQVEQKVRRAALAKRADDAMI
ncbi:hypothetical protein HYALB_00005673 [Hymenoscyphus albidus]|uniref:Nuclear distribution protein RO10 n=1 Tax=Hymenoscyphus albidus TaxID=595503 RepID=A0A9N9PUA8_9HELO|nr:hypothetical protein HYALB_00005673 [Hymenoscyphus albidus]